MNKSGLCASPCLTPVHVFSFALQYVLECFSLLMIICTSSYHVALSSPLISSACSLPFLTLSLFLSQRTNFTVGYLLFQFLLHNSLWRSLCSSVLFINASAVIINACLRVKNVSFTSQVVLCISVDVSKDYGQVQSVIKQVSLLLFLFHPSPPPPKLNVSNRTKLYCVRVVKLPLH